MSTETKFKNGDVITDGLVNGEIIGEGQLGRMRIDGYRIRITSGHDKDHESFINKADAELVVDKSANSSIMTNNKEGDDNDTNTNLLRKTGDLHPGTVGNHGDDVSQREQTVQENERQGQEGTGTTQGGGSGTPGKELNLAGLPGLRGMAESNPGGNSGSEQRLTEPPRPVLVPPAKDIKLDEHSDIGFNAGAAARYDANLAAIKTLKTIEDEHRQATPEEQTILSKYSGFGDSGMGGAFPAYEDDSSSFTNSPWGRRRAELKALTTKEEFENIEHSRLNAFYTTPQVISSMWKALVKMGVDKLSNPHVLEPSAGSGRFLGYEPKELADKSQRVAVELDSLTGRILKQMYPQADTYVMGFEHAPIPKDSIDVAISNVPFGNYPIFDPTFKKGRKKLTESIHNYFFAKTLEELRPGGVLAFITSHMTMDAPTAKPVRQALADQADLVGAIRLPNNAFPDTQVVTDIIFMRKRLEGEKPGDQSWVDTVPQQYKLHSRYGDDFDTKLDVNKYFVDHPDMVLGKPSANGTMNPRRRYDEGEYTVEPPVSASLGELLNRAVTKLPKDIITEAPPNTRRDLKMKFQSGHGVDEGRHVVGEDGIVYVKQGGSLQSANLTHAEEERVKAMMAIRDASKAVVDLQVGNGSDEELEKLQADLDDKYRKFVKSNGPLSTPINHDLMDKDPDAPFLRALEDNSVYKRDKKDLTEADQYLIKVLEGKLPVQDADFAKIQMPVFNQRIIHGLGERAVSTYSDAESVVKNEVGSLDFRMMGEKLGQSENDVIQGLSDRRLIFKNPMTSEWEPADQYLSGDVRLKLKEAEAAASARPKEYKANVEALKIVQPKDIPAGQISVHMGVPWVPATDYNQFVKDLLIEKDEGWRYHRYSYRHDLNKEQYFKYNDITGEWQLIHHPDADMAAETETYGTQRMKADEIIRRILNGKLVEVNDHVEGEDGKKHPVRNPEETIAAQEKAKLIQDKFQEWLWQDPDRTKRLAADYNDKFNNYRPRVFDGAHQVLPGITEKWSKQMHAHQKDAIWRVVQDRTALLAHEVGFGKTAVMVASGMELRRMGLSRKNLYVVPKSTHAQFRDQFLDLYPYAKVLFPTEEDFTPEKRPEFMARAVTGDWDAIIVADSQFSKIPLKPETQARFIADEIETIKQALQQEEEANVTGHYATAKQVPQKNKTQKEIQKQLERYEVKFQYLQQQIAEKSDKAIHFEDIGIDQMYVDEADAYKNLKFVTRMGRIKGLPNSESDRAWDMYSKVRTLQEQKHNGVVFATGTPIANTIAEMYTMIRYLQEPLLEEKGIKHFDAWAKTFGETTESLEQTPTGAYRLTQRFAKFSNAPELSNMWQGTADIRVADEVPAMVAQRPRIVDRNGKSKRIVVATPPDQALLDYMKELAERADNLKNVSRTEDNMLKIASDARKASLDMRLVKADAPVNQNGKVAAACKEIAKIHSETTADKGTQLVFLDLGTPKAKDKAEKEIEVKLDQDGNEIVDFEEDDETQEEKNLLKDVYKGIKAQLIADGIPENEIAFIHDAKNQKQRVALYGKVNKGQIRVMVGSTGKMGAGVNVQERVAALHHIDAPWRPRDIEQREGRAIRQGNIVYGPQKDKDGNILNPGPGVKIFTYVTERSFDAYMWQAIEAKAKAIKSIMRRAVPPRTIEDVDSFTMSASEAKAVASGNPDVFKAVTLKNAVTRFAMLKASHTDSVIRARSKLNEIDESVKTFKEDISKLEKDANLYHENAMFDVEIKDEHFTGTEKDKMDDTSEKASELRARAGEALVSALKKAKDNEKIGTYHRFDIIARDEGPQSGYRIELRNPETKRPHVSTAMGYQAITPSGALIRLDNEYKGVLKGLLENQHELAKLESNRKTYEAQEAKKFEYEDKLAKMQLELADVEKRLQSGEVSNTPSDNYVAEELPDVESEETTEPAYHYNERADEKTEVANDKAEIAATKAEVESVEKETEIKTAPAIEEVAAANKIEEPAKVIESEKPMFRENGATTKTEQEKQASTTEKEAVVNEQPKVETPIVEPEKAKLAPFPGNDPQKTSGSFNVYNLDAYISGKHLTTPAEKVTIPGFEEYNFFIARPTTTGGKFSNKNWDIYEATTGMSIGTLQATKQKAIDEATHKLTAFVGKEKLSKAIADGLEKQGRDRSLAPQPKAAPGPELVKTNAEVVTAPAESSLVQAVRTENHKEEERLAKQGGTGKMVLMTKELAKQFPKLYSGEKIPEGDRLVIAKFFHPMSHQTWYATEYDPEEQIFYGYVDTGDHDSEWGNFSLAEMQDLNVKGLGMERDIHFTPQKIGNVSGLQGRFKSSPEPEVRGTFRQDVPIDEALKEKKAAETAPEPNTIEPSNHAPELNDEFYANMSEGRGFKPVKAKKVVIPGYEKFDLYLHHPVSVDDKGNVVEDKDTWGISEGRSGLYLGDDITSVQPDWAVDRLKSKLARKMTPDKLEQSVENAVKNTGESPKYETETPIAKMQRQVHEIYNQQPETPAAAKAEEPTHPFIGLYKGKQYESHAVSMYATQKEIAKRVGARHDYDVSVYAATETEPLAAAIEHEKTQPEETPFIEEGGPAKRKSKPSIETQAVAHVQQQIPEKVPIIEGNKVERATKPTIETTTKPKLAAFVEVAEKLEGAPVEMKGNRELHDYAGMNPEAAKVMGWPDKDKAILVDEHQPQKTEVKDVIHEVVEVEEMKLGETYHDAHLDALKAETTVKTPEQLEQKAAEIRGDKTASIPGQKLFVKAGYNEWPVKSLEDASKKYRQVVKKTDVGGSQIPTEYTQPLIVDSDGKIIGHIAYNGNVFEGEPKNWTPETKRLYGKAGLTKGKPAITKVHDDGDLTVKKGDTNYVVTTEGKTFKEVKPAPELKDAIQHSHELGEKATRGGQTVSRSAHNAEKAGPIPAPATKLSEQPKREGHPISEAENRAIHAWYGEHGESNHGGKKRMGVLTTKQREALSDSAFAIPEERKYPIHDKNHARAALARVAEFGTPEEKERVAKAIKERYPEEETLNSYATAKTGGHKIMMTPLKDSPHHPVAPKGSRVSMNHVAPHLTKPHLTRKGRGLTRRSDR